MPDSGPGVGKSEAYYSIIRKFDWKDWLEFARGESGLNIPNSVIDEIQFDHRLSIKEQKYQMLLKWEQRLGRSATIEALNQKVNHFYARKGETIAPESAETGGDAQTTAPAASQSTATVNREQMRFRQLLMKISRQLNTNDLEMFQTLYSNVISGRSFGNATQLFFHLDNNNLWGGSGSISEKLTMLKEGLQACGRDDLCRQMEEQSRSFDDVDASLDSERANQTASAVQSTTIESSGSAGYQGNQAIPSDSNVYHGSSASIGKTFTPQNIRVPPRGNTIMGGTFTNSSINMNSGDVITTHTGYTPEEGIVQQLVKDSKIKKQKNINVGVSSERAFIDKTEAMLDMDTDLDDMCTYNGIDVHVRKATKEDYDKHKQASSHIYPVKSKPKGYALILSNINFPVWGSKHRREGGERDCVLMQRLFEGLGLTVIVKEDNKSMDMFEILEKFSQEPYHADADMCIVFVMSHGSYIPPHGDVIYGTDARCLKTEDIVRLFDNDRCKSLRGKPKLFFFQFCRGTTADRGVKYDKPDQAPVEEMEEIIPYPEGVISSPEESLKRLLPHHDFADSTQESHQPTRSDVLIAFATQQGNLSFRTWFTNAIANVFSKKAHTHHICDMLKEVKRGLATRVSNTENNSTNDCKEMADIRDILLKNVYFFPGFP